MNRSIARHHLVSRWGIALGVFLCSFGGPVVGAPSAPLQGQASVTDESVALYQLPAGSRPHVLTIGPDGAVWFSMAGGRCLQGSGNKIARIASGAITEYPLPTAASYPGAIAFGDDGALWFGERTANKIGRMTLDGRVTEYAVPTQVTATVQDGFARGVECSRETSSPAEGGIVAGPDGALWFTEGTGNKIGRVSLDGQVTEYPLPTPNSNPIGIELGPDRALWFIERLGNQVGRITADGAITEYTIPTPDSFPNAIVAGPDGSLWFTELRGDNLARITLDGEITEYPTPGLGPVGLAVGPDGGLWLAGFTGKEVVHMTTDGTIADRYSVAIPEGTPGLCCGVAVTPDGSVWFTATEASLIGRVRARAATSDATAASGAASAGNLRGLVDIGGYRLYIECQGWGSPTVVLDAGFSGSSSVWSLILPEVASFTRVCAYDRANRGMSDRGPVPATAERLAHDLRALLDAVRIPGKFVLVGQSYGGLVDRVFAYRYPGDMGGLVLVDAAPEDYYGDNPGIFPLPPDGVIKGVDLRGSAAEARAAAQLPDIPLIVLVRGGPDPRFSDQSNQLWPAWQEDLSRRAPQGRLITVERSGHDIHIDRPDAVVDAIRTVLASQP